MTFPLMNAPRELLWKISSYLDQPELIILKRVSKIFFSSEELHRQLFAKRSPHLNIAYLSPPSWKELYLSRCLNENNMLKKAESFWIERTQVSLPLRENLNQKTFTTNAGDRFITYFLDDLAANTRTFFIQGLDDDRLLTLQCNLNEFHQRRFFYSWSERSHDYSLHDWNGKVHLLICKLKEFCLYVFEENEVKVIQEFTYEEDKRFVSALLIPPTDLVGSFCLAAITEGEHELKAWMGNTTCSRGPESPETTPEFILNYYIADDRCFVIVQSVKNFIDIYDLSSLEKTVSYNCPSPLSAKIPTQVSLLKHDNCTLFTVICQDSLALYKIPTKITVENQTLSLSPFFYDAEFLTNIRSRFGSVLHYNWYFIKGVPHLIISLEVKYEVNAFLIFKLNLSAPNKPLILENKIPIPESTTQIIQFSEKKGLSSPICQDYDGRIALLHFNPSIFYRYRKALIWAAIIVSTLATRIFIKWIVGPSIISKCNSAIRIWIFTRSPEKPGIPFPSGDYIVFLSLIQCIAQYNSFISKFNFVDFMGTFACGIAYYNLLIGPRKRSFFRDPSLINELIEELRWYFFGNRGLLRHFYR